MTDKTIWVGYIGKSSRNWFEDDHQVHNEDTFTSTPLTSDEPIKVTITIKRGKTKKDGRT
jgi:hypothetical protein